MSAILEKTAVEWWYTNNASIRAHGRGPEVAALLVDRLASVCRQNGCALLLVVQGRPWAPWASVALMEARARELGVPVLNLLPLMKEELTRRPTLRGEWFCGHMTDGGNTWIASQIARAIGELGLPSADSVDR